MLERQVGKGNLGQQVGKRNLDQQVGKYIYQIDLYNMTNYQIGDFLIRLKNASMAGLKDVVFPKTNLVLAVAKTLKNEGFLDSVEVDKEGNLTAKLSIFSKKPVLKNVKIVSKPGLRIYVNVDEIEKMKTPETLIISTPKGIMSGVEAKKKRLGGELIAKVI